MEHIPPSYESAIARDAWAIIAHYIPSSDLCSASLVSQRWHELFVPFLWGDPASHFGTDNDAVYVALTRFRRTLKYARLEVRMLTHTLHLPPALSEIYGGPRPGWLREILEYLPCLQSLMVSKLPFFDHNAMIALKSPSNYAQLANPEASHTYNIRLLLAEREPNTTSQGLAEALLRFPALIYLDLSYTKTARDRTVLSALSQLENLQVLKLRGIGLKDNDAEFLANAIGIRVRFLDLRNNVLTDMALRSLLQASFLPADDSSTDCGTRRITWGTSGPISQSALSSPSSDLLRRPNLDEQFVKILTRPLSGRSVVENLPHVGITHLYIADNQVTVEGVASLLASTRLHALDVGTVNTVEIINKTPYSISSPGHADSPRLPGAEKWIPILGLYAKDNLTYFRARHAVVTADPPVKEYSFPAALVPELPGERTHGELDAPHNVELSATQEVHELPSEVEPRFELADTSVPRPKDSPSPTQEQRVTPNPYEDEPLPGRRRGSVFAPEVIEPNPAEDEENFVLDARGSGLTESRKPPENTLPSISTAADLPSLDSELPELTPRCNSPTAAGDARSERIQRLLSKRPRNHTLPTRDGRDNSFPYFHPSHVPHLETLVLTDVPSHVPANSPILASLIRFITACSNEALLAALQAGSDYSLPPGRDRTKAEQQRSRSFFALRRLVLEITPTTTFKGPAKLTSWKPSLDHQTGASRSSTGDRDSENLWSAAMNDFSFFGEEECGIPENDPGKYFPMAVLNEKVTLMSEDDDSIHSATSEGGPGVLQPNRRTSHRSSGTNHPARPNCVTSMPASTTAKSLSSMISVHQTCESPDEEVADVDLVAELAAFRRQKKVQFEELVRMDRNRRSTLGTTNTAALLSPASLTTPTMGSGGLFSSSSSSSSSSSIPHYVEGHWKGEVKVVRNAAPKGRSGVVDMYGNYFEKGYLYP